MTIKLRPEQRKLWRRIYLNAFETGANVRESCAMADESVAEWEARGAFEEVDESSSSTIRECIPHTHLRLRVKLGDSNARPSPGDIVTHAEPLNGSGVVVSYRCHEAGFLEVHVVACGGNSNVGAEWAFVKPPRGFSDHGIVVGEASSTHEPRS
jgi:hypothetical protein